MVQTVKVCLTMRRTLSYNKTFTCMVMISVNGKVMKRVEGSVVACLMNELRKVRAGSGLWSMMSVIHIVLQV